MFIDASAIVAILLREPGYESIADLIDQTSEPKRVSPCVRIEATLAIARAHSRTKPQTADGVRTSAKAVDQFLKEVGAEEIDITSAIGDFAIEAGARFGKIVGHPARLNFGDCLAYACAKTHRDSLLFVGGDFTHTDLKPAGG